MVLDSSACLDVLLSTGPGRALRPALTDGDPELLAPGLLWVEAGRVLRAKVTGGAVPVHRAEAALADLFDLAIVEAPADPLLLGAWVRRGNVSIDDRMFVSLAEAAERPLLTTDLRLARAVRQRGGVRVITHVD